MEDDRPIFVRIDEYKDVLDVMHEKNDANTISH